MAGRDTPLFTREAISEVHRLSQGYPRLVNIVCDHALLYGYGANLERIDVVTVRECSRDLSVALGLDDVAGHGGGGRGGRLPDPGPERAGSRAGEELAAGRAARRVAGGGRGRVLLALPLNSDLLAQQHRGVTWK